MSDINTTGITTDRTSPTPDPTEVYAQLRKGVGHELVNDGNVFALIEMAERDGHPILAQELREWQSPC